MKPIDKKGISNGVASIADSVMTQVIPTVNTLVDTVTKLEARVKQLESGSKKSAPPKPDPEPEPEKSEEGEEAPKPKRRRRTTKKS